MPSLFICTVWHDSPSRGRYVTASYKLSPTIRYFSHPRTVFADCYDFAVHFSWLLLHTFHFLDMKAHQFFIIRASIFIYFSLDSNSSACLHSVLYCSAEIDSKFICMNTSAFTDKYPLTFYALFPNIAVHTFPAHCFLPSAFQGTAAGCFPLPEVISSAPFPGCVLPVFQCFFV